MTREISKNIRIVTLALLLFAATVLVVFTTPKEGTLRRLHQTDLVQYWAAAHLIAEGRNPYDGEALFDRERDGSRSVLTLSEPIIMWNPPTVLPLIFWLRSLDFEHAKQLWAVLVLAAFLCSVGVASRVMKIKISIRVILPLVLFFPLYSTLELGQISWMLLFALVGSLHFLNSARFLSGGLALAVTCIKPHLLYLYIVGVLAQYRTKDALQLAIGFLLGVSALAIAADILLPGVWQLWWYAFDRPPHYFRTPTLGALLQLLDPRQGWIRYLPMGAMLVACVGMYRSSQGRAILQDPILLLPLSLVTAPYGWVFDQILLLPLVLRIAAHPDWRLSAALVFSHSIAFTPFLTAQHHYVWYPVVLFALGVAEKRWAPRRAQKDPSDDFVQ